VHDIEAKALTFSELLQKRNEVINLIQDREFVRADNVRKAMELPPIDKMSDAQLEEYLGVLSQYELGDVFLTPRTLQTLRTTDLKEAKTLREIQEDLAERTGVSIDQLQQIKVAAWDKFIPDPVLMKKNGFYQLLVKMTHESILGANKHMIQLESEIKVLANDARNSRTKTFSDRIIPQDLEVIEYLETPVEERDPSKLTGEELTYAEYLNAHYTEAFEYLQTMNFIENGIDGYYTHIRRGFLETVKTDGIIQAMQEIFSQQAQDKLASTIIGDDTGNILAKHKFFQFAQKRTGKLVPTQNAARAFISYQSAFQKKRALDSIVPSLDAYVYSLAPRETTARGLELDRTLKKFFNEWMNNKKGRRFSFGGVVQQNGKLDLALRMGRTVTSLLDLALNIPVAVTPIVGEFVLNVQLMTVKEMVIAKKRRLTKKGRKIANQYEEFVGKTVWDSITEASKTFGSKLMEGIFAPFSIASRNSNVDFLLGKMTEAEFQKGEITRERLAVLKLEMGRYRNVANVSSIIGSTSIGGAYTQYKSWAIPTLLSTMQNITTLSKDILQRKVTFKGFLNDKRTRETVRFIMISFITYLAISNLFDDEEKDTIYGNTLKKIKQESLTLLSTIDPRMWTSQFRLQSFIDDLAKNVSSLILLEKYKTKPGFKGFEGLKRQLTPRAVKQFLPKKTKASAPSGPIEFDFGGGSVDFEF